MDALNVAETAALSVLEREGMESQVAAAYIGRARALAASANEKLNILAILERVRKLAAADQVALGSEQQSPSGSSWMSQYTFWHKIIIEEVERLRFNEGYEPIEVHLYPVRRNAGSPYGGVAYLGKTQIGHHQFQAIGTEAFDDNGVRMLTVEIRAKKQPQ